MAAAHVLTDANLILQVISFQDGIYDVLRPVFAHRDALVRNWRRVHLVQKYIGCLNDPRSVLLLLIEQDRLDLVQRFIKCRRDLVDCARGPHCMDTAAALGRLDIIKYFHCHQIGTCSTSAMDLAARNGHLEVVRFLHDHRTEGCTTDAMDLAAAHGHLEIVQFLHAFRTEGFTRWAVHWASQNGHERVVLWFHQL
ncbi:hypothetical protein LEN26_002058 [Aphanomyces euteiches]|nr:hypothetical protein AeMF1_005628 [Aphanomyces euteiches]KAH9160004.1 hypothetical protein LEN26_002058 [Aphanomyces euteiches]KAH9182963.1 hypothetical protein AeNC1_015059 [Aphanomyces euteiches]